VSRFAVQHHASINHTDGLAAAGFMTRAGASHEPSAMGAPIKVVGLPLAVRHRLNETLAALQ
jgi:hypothetical protein